MKRRTGVLAAVACALSVGTSAAGEAPSLARVELEADAAARVESVGEVRAGGVLRLRLVEDGRLEVRRMMFEELEWRPRLLPRVVSVEPGREEVEVVLPEEVESGEEEVVVRYEWGWKHQEKPAMERRWRLVMGEEQRRQQAWARAFEEEFPLGEEAQAEVEAEPEQGQEQPEWLGVGEEAVSPRVEASQPEVLRVWAQASRAEIAEQLFGEPGAVNAFDYEACEAPEESEGLMYACVRVRQVEALRPPLRAEVRQALEVLLEEEKVWLLTWLPAEWEVLALAERSLTWAQRSEVRDEQGRSYWRPRHWRQTS
jgi:hypothetical protein